MRKRALFILFIFFFLALIIGGCGGSDEKASEKQEPTVESTLEPTPTPEVITAQDSDAANEEEDVFDEPIEVVEVLHNANLRSGPGTEFEIVGIAMAGDTYPYIGWTENGWVKIEQLGEVWVGLSLVEIKTGFHEDSNSTDPEPSIDNTAVSTNTKVSPTPTPVPPPLTPTPEGEYAEVVRIVDGDTIEVSMDGQVYPVRYIGIDTAEYNEPCGPEATHANARLVEGQTVRMEKDVNETDPYDRLLRYVYVGDQFVNAELVRQGWAEPKRYPPDTAKAVYLENQKVGAPTPSCQTSVQPTNPPPAVQATEAPPAVAQPTDQPATTTGPVVIIGVNKGTEYVDIQNQGSADVDLDGWMLRSEKGNQDCGLGGIIGAGQTLRIWALAADAGQGGFNCGFGSNIWNNSDHDPAVLFQNGVEVSRR